MQETLNKVFKYNAVVYVAMCDDYGDFSLVKGHVRGVRKFKTAVSEYRFLVETPLGEVDALPFNIYESVEDFKNAVSSRVVE